MTGFHAYGDSVYRYILFVNPERTRMASCWPTPTGNEWKVDRAEREHSSHTWGPPDTAVMVGDIDSLTLHFKSHGLTERELVR